MSKGRFFPTHDGLISPDHREKIGSALWEFLWMISRTTKEITEDGEIIGVVLGGKPVKVSEIVEEAGGSERTVKRNITKLKEHGYVSSKRTPYGEIFYVSNSKKFKNNRSAKSGTSEKKGEVPKVYREVPNLSERSAKSVQRDAKSGTSNKDIKGYKGYKDIYVEIIDYLNQKTGKRFSPKSDVNKKIINGRVSEGRNVDDFKKVIDTKCEEWIGDEKMNQYLRPSTLFRPNNFENYLNQVTEIPKQSDPRDKEIEFQKFIQNGGEPDEFNWNG